MLERLCNDLYYEMRLVLRSVRYLKNWRELIRGTRREKRGERITESPILHFRNGLKIGLVPGGYGGFYMLFPEIFVTKCYQPTREFSIRDGWTVVDIGANMGFFTCWVATEARISSIVSVEPIQEYVNVLRENICRNGLTDIKVIHAAATDKPVDQVPIPVWYTPSGELRTGMPISPDLEVYTQTVRGLTLREIFNQGEVEDCHLLKIDIEGAEYALFEGSQADVWNRVERVIMETHQVEGRTTGELIRVLDNAGFQTRIKGHMLWGLKRNLSG